MPFGRCNARTRGALARKATPGAGTANSLASIAGSALTAVTVTDMNGLPSCVATALVAIIAPSNFLKSASVVSSLTFLLTPPSAGASASRT